MIEHDKIKGMSDRMAQAEVKGRSPWADARKRFFRNRAALVALVVLVLIGLFAAFGNSIAAWSNEDIDYEVMGSAATLGAPSIANGHYFGTDDLGRDMFARTVQGTQISLMVGIVGAPGMSDAGKAMWLDRFTRMHEGQAWKDILAKQG